MPAVPLALVGRPRGRHAKPPRTGQPVLAGVLAVSLGGGTTALAAGSASASEGHAETVVTTSATAAPETGLADLSLAGRDLASASRTRSARAPAPAPPPAPPPPPVLPGCEGEPENGYANGRIPSSALCALPGHDGHRLRADAARALVRLGEAYRADTGRPLCITDTYRSYEAQQRLRWQKGRLAAHPGRSNHGTGIAVDFCGGVESFGTRAHRWMQARAGEFGWVHPTWARAGGRKPEPWHWEYRG